MMDPDSIVTVRQYGNATEAFLAKEWLEEAGIEAMVANDHPQLGMPVDLQVFARDLEAANQVLEREESGELEEQGRGETE